jgi:hypothetical protein
LLPLCDLCIFAPLRLIRSLAALFATPLLPLLLIRIGHAPKFFSFNQKILDKEIDEDG